MKQTHTYIILLGLLLLLFCPIQAQNTSKEDLPAPHIRVTAGIGKDKIHLRWAVDQAAAWQKTNKAGFTLKRYTLMRGGNLLSETEEKNLGTFLPKPEQDWKDIIETNDHAAIVAQSLYGEDFEVEMGKPAGGLEGIMNKSEEIDQRFAYALMAADLDYEVACLAGWGYTDTDVKPTERYVYIVEINPASQVKNLQVEKGQAVASLDEYQDLPTPIGFIGIFQDHSVTLAWEYLQLRDHYTAYFIEKSEDKINFQPLDNLPVINMNDRDDKPAPGMIYIDSLAHNGKPYYYRLRGKTIFGEYSPYSNIITGEGKKMLDAVPRISAFDILNDGNISLTWEFPQESEKDLTGFELLHSENDEKGSYRTVKDKIPATARTLTTASLSPSNYFKIKAVGKNKDQRESFAALVQPEDSIPPATPVQLIGKIDSLGIVRLSWQPNTEKDLAGYHVFRATLKGQEPVRLTPQAIETAYYTDSVQLENLNSKVYYCITAIDIRKNQSPESILLELEKPDKIKPEAPVFTEYLIEDGSIQLKWLKSYSEDATEHLLYRKSLDNSKDSLKIVYRTQELLPEYTYADKDVMPDARYRYYLQAIDKSGLRSDNSQEITLRNIDTRPAGVITNLTGQAGKNKIELGWKVDSQKEITEIKVYRKKADEKATLWGTLPGAQNFLEDTEVQPGTSYTYLLKAMQKSNQPVKTETITVAY